MAGPRVGAGEVSPGQAIGHHAPVPRDQRRRLLGWMVGLVVVVAAGAAVAWRSDRSAEPVLAPPATTAGSVAGGSGDGEASAPPATAPGTSLPGDPERVPLPGFDEVAVRVLPPGEEEGWLSWCLLAARTAAQRSQGLMTVTDLQGYPGMAFLYEEDVDNAFWMRNTPTPLSIAWISADGQVVSTADMAPCGDQPGCPTYPPAGPYRYAIEVFQGDLPALGIAEGATVEVGGECGPRA